MIRRSTQSEDFITEQSLQELSLHKAPYAYFEVLNLPIANSVTTPVAPYTNLLDPWRMQSAGVITLPYPGVWLFQGYIRWVANSSGERYSDFNESTGAIPVNDRILPNALNPEGQSNLVSSRPLGGGTRIVMRVFQNSGGTLNIAYANFSIIWLGGVV